MTDIIEDNVQVDLQIGTERLAETGSFPVRDEEPGKSSFDEDAIYWDVIELKVEISQVVSPNYVKGRVTIKPEFSNSINKIVNSNIDENNSLPNNGISRLVGSRFRLEANNELVALPENEETNTSLRGLTTEQNVEEDNLLFDGRLANISPVGTNVYEIVAYDPGQQAFNIGEESGSIINQKLDFTGEEINFRDPEDSSDNNVTGDHSQRAIDIAREVADAAGLGSKTNIQNSAFRQARVSTGINRAAYIRVEFEKLVVPVKEALNRVREATNTEWWFDKDGTFYFGDPATFGGGVSTYETRLIKDTSAGITTPPYQSVRVIGSGVATTEGWSGSSKIQDDEDKIVKEANIGLPSAGGEQSEVVIELDPRGELTEPTFKYINAEISTDEQAQNTALKIADELIKQQAEGKVTVVGFPEIQPFDGILMPNSDEQPMGGQLYDVYSVTHKLNGSDGFVTEIEVAGPNPKLRGDVTVRQDEDGNPTNIIATSTDRDVYTPDGQKRAFKPGAGEGSAINDPSINTN